MDLDEEPTTYMYGQIYEDTGEPGDPQASDDPLIDWG